MMRIKAPLKLKSLVLLSGTVGFTEGFVNRIMANYVFMTADIRKEELLYLLLGEPEQLRETSSVMVLVENTSIENRNDIIHNMINQLINRIITMDINNVTYQDNVYITCILKKLGITDVSRFIKQFKNGTEEFFIKEQILNLYQNQKADFVKVCRNLDINQTKYTLSVNKALKDEENYLYNAIYKRLMTVNHYQTLYKWNHCQGRVNYYLSQNELTLAEQYEDVLYLELAQIREKFTANQYPFESGYGNEDEIEILKNREITRESVLTGVIEAAVLWLIKSYAVLRKSYHQKGKNDWYQIHYGISNVIRNTFERFRYYYQDNLVYKSNSIHEWAETRKKMYGYELRLLSEFNEAEVIYKNDLVPLSGTGRWEDIIMQNTADSETTLLHSVYENGTAVFQNIEGTDGVTLQNRNMFMTEDRQSIERNKPTVIQNIEKIGTDAAGSIEKQGTVTTGNIEKIGTVIAGSTEKQGGDNKGSIEKTGTVITGRTEKTGTATAGSLEKRGKAITENIDKQEIAAAQNIELKGSLIERSIDGKQNEMLHHIGRTSSVILHDIEKNQNKVFKHADDSGGLIPIDDSGEEENQQEDKVKSYEYTTDISTKLDKLNKHNLDMVQSIGKIEKDIFFQSKYGINREVTKRETLKIFGQTTNIAVDIGIENTDKARNDRERTGEVAKHIENDSRRETSKTINRMSELYGEISRLLQIQGLYNFIVREEIFHKSEKGNYAEYIKSEIHAAIENICLSEGVKDKSDIQYQELKKLFENNRFLEGINEIHNHEYSFNKMSTTFLTNDYNETIGKNQYIDAAKQEQIENKNNIHASVTHHNVEESKESKDKLIFLRQMEFGEINQTAKSAVQAESVQRNELFQQIGLSETEKKKEIFYSLAQEIKRQIEADKQEIKHSRQQKEKADVMINTVQITNEGEKTHNMQSTNEGEKTHNIENRNKGENTHSIENMNEGVSRPKMQSEEEGEKTLNIQITNGEERVFNIQLGKEGDGVYNIQPMNNQEKVFNIQSEEKGERTFNIQPEKEEERIFNVQNEKKQNEAISTLDIKEQKQILTAWNKETQMQAKQGMETDTKKQSLELIKLMEESVEYSILKLLYDKPYGSHTDSMEKISNQIQEKAEIYYKTTQNDENNLRENQGEQEDIKVNNFTEKSVSREVINLPSRIKTSSDNTTITETQTTYSRDINELIQTNIRNQVGNITEQVYRKIEKKLQNERKRRGL